MSDLTIRLRRGSGSGVPPERTLSAAAAIGGAVSAAVTLSLSAALALIGWFLADAGAHGATTDAIRVGADLWLVGHGSHFTLSGMPLGITPLSLSMLLVLGAFRGGRWAARRSDEDVDDRGFGVAVATFCGVYVAIAVVVCVAASQTGAEASLGRSAFGALLVAAVGGGAGLAVGCGKLESWVSLVPGWIREVTVAAVTGALLLLAAGAVLVVISLMLSFNEGANVVSSMHLSSGDAISFLVVIALFAPNAALFGSAYLLGPGFAIGVKTTVSPAAPVVLGAIPAFPVLAALPSEGPTPGWLILLCAIPTVCAAFGVTMAGRYSEPLPFDLAATRGAASGFGSGVVIAFAIALSGGPMGTDRLATVGAPTGEIFVFALASMVIGGVIGGLLQSWWQRRR